MSDDISQVTEHQPAEHQLVRQHIPLEYASQRLDSVLVKMFPDYSRSRLQQWIRAGKVLLDGQVPRPRDKVIGEEMLELHIEPEVCVEEVQAEDIPLDIVYEDEDILVVNKPAGLVVHPAAGHSSGTLQNALLHYDNRLESVPRSGIVHRLDKDTSGLLVVARNLKAHKSLVAQLQARTVKREYQAVVVGVLTAGNTIDMPMGRHGRDRKKMAIKPEGKAAITHFRVLERFRGHTLVQVNLETGRTHQIRVHMAYVRYPLVGDQTYGGRLQLPAGCSDELKQMLRSFNRQALHAKKLGLIHPSSGKAMEWRIPLPEDMRDLLDVLQADITRPSAEDGDDEDYSFDEFLAEFGDEFTHKP